MSLKSSLLALANNIGMCQENARSIKQCLELGLIEASKDASGIDNPASYKTVWTNSTPDSDYADTPVTITGGDIYDAFIIYYLPSAGKTNSLLSCMLPKSFINDSTDHAMNFIDYGTASGTIIRDFRTSRLTQAEGSHDIVVTFGHGRVATIETYGTAGTTTNNDTKMKPMYILGVKF